MSATSRRSLLTAGAAGVSLAATGAVPCPAKAMPRSAPKNGGRSRVPFPPLVPDPDRILALAEGFSYALVTRAGVTRPLCSEVLAVLPGVTRGAFRQPPAWFSLAGYGAVTARGIVVAWGRGER